MADLIQDARYALRALVQNPGFATAAVLTVALAIGAITAMFTIANGVLLRALPYPDSDALVRLYSVDPTEPLQRGSMSLPDIGDWQDRTRAFAGIAGYRVLPHVLLGRDEPQELPTAYVTARFFDVLRAPMALGRALDEADSRNAARNVVISSGLWRSAFGRDPDVIGTVISLQGAPHTIVGVAGSQLRFPAPDIALWLPESVLGERTGQRTRSNRDFNALARLAPAVSTERALAEVRTLAAQLAREHPDTNERFSGADVVPLLDTMVAHVERALMLVLGVVSFIALIACANVANLLLARGATRSHEVATRIALGASRGRIARQVLTESCVLSLVGGALGVGLAFAAVELVLALYADSLPRAEDVQIDSSVLAFAFGASLASSALFGWLPAWRTARSDPRRHLGASRGVAGVPSELRGALVVGEVALAVVLVVGATLMSRSFVALRGVDAGFDAERVLTVSLQVNVSSLPAGTSLPAHLLERRREITERIAALPGVEHAAITSRLPLRDGASRFAFRRSDGSDAAGGERLVADARNVSADYFRALRIPVLRGTTPVRDAPITFGAQSDRFEGQRPIAVSVSAAERFWPGEDAVGKVIDGGWFEAVVVGVVGDVRQVGLAESPGPTLYFADGPQINATVVVRSTGDPALLAGPIRGAIRELDPNQSIRSIALLRDVMADSIANDRFFTLLYLGFGALALTLAVVGVYGVVSYSVGLRTRELAVRAAVGASPAAILRSVFAGGLRPVLAGIALGSLAALALARTIEQQLYGIDAHDPWSFAVAPAILVAATLLACYAPARTAARTDPTVALRSE